MADNRNNDNKTQGNSRESKREAWQERKMEKAKRDDIDVISRRTMDQSDYISILNSHDYLLYQLRMNMGRNKELIFDKVKGIIERSQKIKEEINLLNAEMCQLMGYKYKPPRGFTNPFAETEEKDKPIKKTATKAPASAKATAAAAVTD